MKTGKFRSSVAQSPKTEYVWIASAALILTLVISLFAVVPRVAAEESPPSSFPSEAAAIEYFVGLQAASRQSMRITQFPSEAAAIEYFVGLQAASRQSMSVAKFPSEAAAIEYFVGLQAASRNGKATASEGVGERPFPEVGGPIVESIVTGMGQRPSYTNVSEFYVEKLRAARDSALLALEGVAEEPFPEVEGLNLASVAVRTGQRPRYTDVSEFYVEKLRAAIIRSQAGLSR